MEAETEEGEFPIPVVQLRGFESSQSMPSSSHPPMPSVWLPGCPSNSPPLLLFWLSSPFLASVQVLCTQHLKQLLTTQVQSAHLPAWKPSMGREAIKGLAEGDGQHQEFRCDYGSRNMKISGVDRCKKGKLRL